jgi:hypothetical protein
MAAPALRLEGPKKKLDLSVELYGLEGFGNLSF